MGRSNVPAVGTTRRFVQPEPGDTLASIAERELPGMSDGARLLLSWNLHLATRPPNAGGPGSVLLCDLVYVEPPAA